MARSEKVFAMGPLFQFTELANSTDLPLFLTTCAESGVLCRRPGDAFPGDKRA